VITGYIVDPQFRGGVLIRHSTSQGTVITQYWHVWPRPGFGVGTPVKRGQVFADVADMGALTHLHFAVFRGNYDPHAWNGALAFRLFPTVSSSRTPSSRLTCRRLSCRPVSEQVPKTGTARGRFQVFPALWRIHPHS
jgi:hypothetical protein